MMFSIRSFAFPPKGIDTLVTCSCQPLSDNQTCQYTALGKLCSVSQAISLLLGLPLFWFLVMLTAVQL